MSGPVATARPTQALRLRRESQRPGVARTVTRPSTMEDDGAKTDGRRYVYTQQDILARHKGKPPSMRIFLHPKHFRINDSADMLEYSSPMREILQHIKTRTVPHNMVDDFYAMDMPFYDNCLIVEVHDYRSGGVKPRDDTNSLGDSGTNAFSIHNYNNFITPSPFAPYPSATKGDASEEKENMPAPPSAAPSQQKQPGKPKVWTTVLFPTAQSHLADMQLLATTPMPDMATLKRMQQAGRMPSTPMTTVPPTPTFPGGRSPKRQKMILDDNNTHEFEADVYNATCPKLYLEPTKTFAESLALIDAVTHPNNKNDAPARKTRKRTTAELQADEADAAATQRFMLAGDEQQANMATTATGGDEGAVRASANSQNFARMKTLAAIKANHEEADRRKKEEDARNALQKRAAQNQAEEQRKRESETNRQQAELMERQQALLRQQASQQQMQQTQMQQNQMQQNEALRAATQAQQMANASAVQAAQTPQSATQPQFSPVVRNGTPMAAAVNSPRVGGPVSHPMGGTPMIATASNHAIASPARPPSAVSHHNMARSVSQQQNMSRTGTPQMVQGTPVMGAVMPNRSTPTPVRMNQGSPQMGMQGGTPIMMQTPQQSITPEHMQRMQQQQAMQQRMLQQQRMAQQAGSINPAMNSQLQTLAMQKANMQVQQHGVPNGQDPAQYLNMLARRMLQQLQSQHLQQQQQAQQQQAMQNMSPQGSQQGMNPASMNLAQLRQHHAQRRAALLSQYGQQIPQHEMARLRQLEAAIMQRQSAEQTSQMQMAASMGNPQMQNQMQQQMQQMQQNGGTPTPGGTPIQMQAYQQLLQQQRAAQARNQQLMAMRQQAMQQGGQIPQGMMNNVNMQGMQGMNMQGMNMGGMQGMGGGNMGGGQMNQQQVQQMMMLRAQQQAQQQQRMGQQGGGGGDMGGWSG